MSLETLRVIAFPGAPNLPLFAAMEQGFLAREGLELDLTLTPSSVFQAEQCAAGHCQIAMTAFDNVVAYTEGQGAAGPDVDPQYVAVMGATQLELALVTTPDVQKFADLKGRTLALDALATGFAFVLSEMLERAGLSRDDAEFVAVGATPQRWESVKAGEHAGTLTIEPFTTIAQRAGSNVLQKSSDLFDAYQGGIIAACRPFAKDHPEKLRGFLRAYLDGLDWVSDPANHAAAAELLQARMPAIRPEAIGGVMRNLLNPASGLTPGGAILRAGMDQVLDLRTRHGPSGQALTDIEKYLDLTHMEAIAKERSA